MTIPVAGYLRRAAGWLDYHLGSRALVLLYHQVTELRTDPWALAVTPRHFAEHLAVLRRSFRPMRLQQLLSALRRGRLPRGAIAVTFDDGYADNLSNAEPLLQQHDVPATIFLPTGAIGQGHEFWWDELDRLLLQPGTLPHTLRLRISGETYTWELDAAATYSEDDVSRHRGWRAWQPPPGPRHRLFYALWELLHPLAADERSSVLDDLRAWARAEPGCRPTHRTMSAEGVLALARDGLVEVGAHTVTHPALSTLPVAAQRDEIRQSKAQLEAIIGRPVTSFAYPYGKRRDYTAATIDLLRDAGFTCACTNVAAVIKRSTDPFETPRLLVEDWDAEAFTRRLRRWFYD